MNVNTDISKPDDTSENSEKTVERGQAAIAAEQVANPKEPGQKEKEQQADAEAWRNEG